MCEVTEFAYAKINLYLEIIGKRSDGYHDLRTVMRTVSLCDTLTVRRIPDRDIKFDMNGDAVADAESNLAVKAIRAYEAACGERFGLSVSLSKRIPMAAGMGGGSADAAAALRAVNRLNKNRFSDAELRGIGVTVGADVPFCVTGGCAVCEGIGELITPVPDRLRLPLVLAIAGQGMPTVEAFGAYDACRQVRHGDESAFVQTLVDALKKGDAQAAVSGFRNDFEPVIEQLRPSVTQCKKMLLQSGAMAAQMSGSGPSVFGIFSDEEAAYRAAETLTAVGITACLAFPTDQI